MKEHSDGDRDGPDDENGVTMAVAAGLMPLRRHRMRWR